MFRKIGHFGHSGKSGVFENGLKLFLMDTNLGIDNKIKSLISMGSQNGMPIK